MAALPTLPSNRAALFDGFLRVLHDRERSAREARRDGRSVPAIDSWLAALAELAEALQRVQPNSADDPTDSQPGMATTLPRAEWPATMTPSLLEFAIDASVLQMLGNELRFTHQLLQEALASRLLLEASAQGSLPATHFWPTDRWWRRNGWEVVAEIATEACAGDEAALWRLLGWLVLAQPELALEAWRYAGAPALPISLTQTIRQHWLSRLTEARAEPAPAARAAIGRALGAWGLDDRPGAGVRSDGLPDISWMAIPETEPVVCQGDLSLQLPGFEIARFPITHRQYQVFIDVGGYRDERWWQGLAFHSDSPTAAQWTEPNAPRERVNWYEAMAYCHWLSTALGQVIRLPTEQQWARAARGRKGAEYPWGNGYEAGRANCNELSSKLEVGTFMGRTTAVGIYPSASAEGVLDLAGNVWEWCLNAYSAPDNTSIAGDVSRVLRGGSWNSNSRDICAAHRSDLRPVVRLPNVGFRVCRVHPIDQPPTGARHARLLAP